MRIAVTYMMERVFPHFGKASEFKIYDVENGEIVKSEVISTNGQGHGAMAKILLEQKVNVVICGGIGGPAIEMLAKAGIDCFPGNAGPVDDVVKAFLAGSLRKPAAGVVLCNCSHDHAHGEGHDCGCSH